MRTTYAYIHRGEQRQSREGCARRGRVSGPVVKMHATDAVDATASLPSSTAASRSFGHELSLVLVLLVSCWIVQDRLVLGMSEPPPELTTAEGKFYSLFEMIQRSKFWFSSVENFVKESYFRKQSCDWLGIFF